MTQKILLTALLSSGAISILTGVFGRTYAASDPAGRLAVCCLIAYVAALIVDAVSRVRASDVTAAKLTDALTRLQALETSSRATSETLATLFDKVTNPQTGIAEQVRQARNAINLKR